MEYLESLGDQEKAKGSPAREGQPASDAGAASFLRDYWLAPAEDEKNHVIVRTRDGMVLLNAFPYANGHLLVALGEGRSRLLDYTPQQRAALWRLTDLAADLMETGLSPQGINIGVNQGRAGGAGVPGHLHVHLVPRWGGDINFMTAVARVRVIPSSLEVMAKRYREAWRNIRGRWTP
jgi:ATP adenylyltransferase